MRWSESVAPSRWRHKSFGRIVSSTGQFLQFFVTYFFRQPVFRFKFLLYLKHILKIAKLQNEVL